MDGAAIGASFALGPFIGGSLTAMFGWRAIFLVNVPIGVAVVWITYRRVADGRDPTPRRVDVPGQVTLIGGLFLLVLALLRGNVDGWGSAAVIAALAGAALLLVGFVVVEARSREPMLRFACWGSVNSQAQIAVFAIASSFFAIFLYVTLYLQTVLAWSPRDRLVYLPGTFLVFVTSGMTAQLGELLKIASLGLALIGAGLAGLLIVDVGSSWTVLLPGLLVASIGTGLFNLDRGSELALRALPFHQKWSGRRRQRHVPPDRWWQLGSRRWERWCQLARPSAGTLRLTSTDSTTR